jgi:drug/metabolite transporter (DMT)-like permease
MVKGRMKAADLTRLVALAAIWGASFLFVRIASPAIGPVLTADSRMLIAAAALAVYFRAIGFDAQWRRWWPQYVIVGLLTSALPFLLFAYAALSLTAGLMSVINASSPMWGAIFSAWLLRERLSRRGIAGLAIGVAGVGLVTRPEAGASFAVLPVLAATGAAVCYGLAGAYMRRWAKDVPSRGMALGTQIAGGVLLVPLLVLTPSTVALTPLVAACVLAMGLACGAVAYLLYFRLVTDIGAAGALTVTYLIPIFGVAWGALFLGETVSLVMLAGAGLVLLGTFFVLRK